MGWKVGPTTSVLVFNLPFLTQVYSSSIKMVVSLQYSEDGLRMRIGKKCKTRLRDTYRKPGAV